MNYEEIKKMNAVAWEIYGGDFSKMAEPVCEVGSARDAILRMVEKGYMRGYEDGKKLKEER